MMNAATDTNVLIVGAGPVGLFLANECDRRGLSFRIVEEQSSQSEHSKALAIFPRTLEIQEMGNDISMTRCAVAREFAATSYSCWIPMRIHRRKRLPKAYAHRSGILSSYDRSLAMR